MSTFFLPDSQLLTLIWGISEVRKNRMNPNYVGVGFTAAFVIGGGSTDSHYLVLAASEIVCLTLITLKTMKWSGAEGERESISFRMAPTKGGATAALTWRF